MPEEAMILCAGFGTRMAPLSRILPKPLFPLWGTPLIEHVLLLLEAWGIRHVVLNTHHGAEAIRAFVSSRTSGTASVDISYEHDIMGTGGALREAAPMLGSDTFWLVNGDIVFDVEPAPFLRAFAEARGLLAALWVTRARGPMSVDVHNGHIQSFVSPCPGGPRTATFCGLHLVHSRVLDFVPPEGFSSITDCYKAALESGESIRAVETRTGFWQDAGTESGYLAAHRRTLAAYTTGSRAGRHVSPGCLEHAHALSESGTTIKGFAALAPDTRVGPKCSLRDVVAWPGTALEAETVAHEAVLGRGVRVGGDVSGLTVCASDTLASCRHAIRDLNWPEDQTVVSTLPGRGSDRSFSRLRTASDTAIFVEYTDRRPENARYASHARFLREIGVRGPRVLLDCPAQRWSVFEDLGIRDLTGYVKAASDNEILDVYTRVIEMIVCLHTRGTDAARKNRLALEPAFDEGVYEWERALFDDWFLCRHMELNTKTRVGVLESLKTLQQRLSAEPTVLLHRDLQSSNILLTQRGPTLIDFQGMRMGPAVYDLGALLCDPYVCLPPDIQHTLCLVYAHRAGIAEKPLLRAFWYGSVQRLIQAIGAYARLSVRSETARFKLHLQPALEMLVRCLEHVDINELNRLRDTVSRWHQQEERAVP